MDDFIRHKMIYFDHLIVSTYRNACHIFVRKYFSKQHVVGFCSSVKLVKFGVFIQFYVLPLYASKFSFGFLILYKSLEFAAIWFTLFCLWLFENTTFSKSCLNFRWPIWFCVFVKPSSRKLVSCFMYSLSQNAVNEFWFRWNYGLSFKFTAYIVLDLITVRSLAPHLFQEMSLCRILNFVSFRATSTLAVKTFSLWS